MNENSERRNYGRDALGGLLVLVGLFSAVSFFMAMLKPLESVDGGPTGFYMAVAGFVGPIAGFFASAGLALIGARLWAKGVDLTVLRHLGGVALTTFTLSILVGTLVPNLAGEFGAGIASKVADRFHVIVAVMVGIALVLLPAWFLWLRPTERARERADSKSVDPKVTPSSESDGVTAAEAEALLPVAKPAAAKPAPRTTSPVASAPAEAPAPKPVPSPYPTDVRRSGGIPEGARPLESRYAKPAALPSHDAPVQRPTVGAPTDAGQRSVDAPVARVTPATPERAAEPERVFGSTVAGSAALAGDFDVEPQSTARPLSGASSPVGFAAGIDEDRNDDTDDIVAPERAQDDFDDDESVEQEFISEVRRPSEAKPLEVMRTPPAPSWEQPALFNEVTEEPVDAYGTPLELVEALRGEARTPEQKLDDDEVASTPLAEATSLREVDLTGVDLEDDADVSTVRPLEMTRADNVSSTEEVDEDDSDDEVLAAERDEPQAPAEVAQAPRTHPTVIAPTLFEAAESVKETTADVAPHAERIEVTPATANTPRPPVARSLFDDLPVETMKAPAKTTQESDAMVASRPGHEPVAAQPSHVAEESRELAEDELDGDVRFDVTLDEAGESEEDADAAVPELFTEASVEETGAAREEERLESTAEAEVTAPAVAEVELTPKAPPRVEAPAGPSAESGAELAPAAMSDVVLQPQPARAPKTRTVRTVSEPVFKAGLLFVERNRVAVSMLQREFQMDFKQATEVLDQLQQAGLIGPYLGGQRRDILLTADQWRETVEVE